MSFDRIRQAVVSGEKFAFTIPVSISPDLWTNVQYWIRHNMNYVRYMKQPVAPEVFAALRGIDIDVVRAAVGEDWQTDRGLLNKRVQSYLFKTHGAKMFPAGTEALAQFCNRYKSGGDYVLDFTSRLEWRGGAYGDHGSCFMGDGRHMQRMMEAGFLAVRFYDANTPNVGIARAWVKMQDDNYLAMCNSYGYDLNMTSQVLAKWLGEPYIVRDIGYRYDTNIHINGGGVRVIGRESFLALNSQPKVTLRN